MLLSLSFFGLVCIHTIDRHNLQKLFYLCHRHVWLVNGILCTSVVSLDTWTVYHWQSTHAYLWSMIIHYTFCIYNTKCMYNVIIISPVAQPWQFLWQDSGGKELERLRFYRCIVGNEIPLHGVFHCTSGPMTEFLYLDAATAPVCDFNSNQWAICI